MGTRRRPAPCASPGCPTLTRQTYCPAHAPPPWPGRRNYEGYTGQWPKTRAQVLTEEPTCQHCGAPSTTVDHIVPKARGGTDDRSNLQALCKKCHDTKSKREAVDGRRGKGPKKF